MAFVRSWRQGRQRLDDHAACRRQARPETSHPAALVRDALPEGRPRNPLRQQRHGNVTVNHPDQHPCSTEGPAAPEASRIGCSAYDSRRQKPYGRRDTQTAPHCLSRQGNLPGLLDKVRS
jgi:hypothetical protein